MGTTRNFSLNRKFKGEKITVKLKKILEPKLPTTFQAASSQDFTDGEVYQAEFTDQTLTISQRTIFSGCSFKNTTFELLTTRSVNLQIAFSRNVIYPI